MSLSYEDTKSLLEFIDLTTLCQSISCFKDIIERLPELIPHKYTIHSIANFDRNNPMIIERLTVRNDFYPTDWARTYDLKKYENIDPVVLHSLDFLDNETEAPIILRWKDCYEKYPPHPKFLIESKEADLHDGFAVSWKTPNRPEYSNLSISGGELDFCERTEKMLGHIMPHMHRAFSVARSKAEAEILTDREREILQLIAKGLKRQAIASELDISVNGVKRHVERIFEKLDAHNSQNAIGIGLSKGIIELLA